MDSSLDDEIRLTALLELLSGSSWVSTHEILKTFDASAQTLAGAIQRLSDWGLTIGSLNGAAYRLESPIQLLRTSRIRGELPPDWQAVMGISVLPVVDSTNTRLLCDWPNQLPWAILAEYQSDGRGRRGRRWYSPFGVNLYLSVAWAFDRTHIELSTLPLAMGVCCIRALAPLGLAGLVIKWPNDLWINEAKLGGILVESCNVGEVLRVVVGVGINVNMDLGHSPPGAVLWTTLRNELTAQDKEVPDRNVLASALLTNIANGLRVFSAQGFGPFLNEWAARDMTRDRLVSVGVPEKITGIACGINEKGALRVKTSEGLILVESGDISIRVVSK